MLAAVVDPDVLDLIPGDKNTFFRKLEKCLNVSYTDAGLTCLLQGRYMLKKYICLIANSKFWS